MGYVAYGNSNTANQGSENGIGYFSLKNDGDEAIVRIMHDSTNDFEIISTHQIQLNGKFRRVSCVRNPKDSVSACPLCESGVKVDYRFYIHLVQYTKAEDGSVVAEQKVWERPMSYADKISGYINNYGPMSDVICKIIRHGKAGDMKTEYDIIPNLNKQVYRDDIFVKPANAFEGFKALGRMVLDKTADEINEFIRTGNFPMRQKKEETVEQKQTEEPNWNLPEKNDAVTWSVEETPVTQTVTQAVPRPTFNNWSTNKSSQVQRPTRF